MNAPENLYWFMTKGRTEYRSPSDNQRGPWFGDSKPDDESICIGLTKYVKENELLKEKQRTARLEALVKYAVPIAIEVDPNAELEVQKIIDSFQEIV